MKYGMPTLVECKTLRDCAEVARELSLDFIEINMSFPEYTPAAFDIAGAVKLAKEYNLFYTIHADEALNPFDFNPTVSDCYFKVMRDTLTVAKRIGAKVVNLHLQKGIYVTLTDRVILLTDVYKEEYLERVRAFIAMCEEELKDTDIKVAIENVDSNPFTPSQREALGLFLASPVFALTLDTGHEAKLGFKDSDIYDKYPDKLLHMHLHDCKGGSPHIPLGTGEVDIAAKLALLKGDTCLIEVKTIAGLKESDDYLKKHKI